MCLSKLKEFRDRGWGYKVLTERHKKLYATWQGKQEKPYLKNRWLDEKDYRHFSPNNISTGMAKEHYPTGFHIFMSKSGAFWWKGYRSSVYKVKYKEIQAKGTQARKNVVVARKMLIMEEVQR